MALDETTKIKRAQQFINDYLQKLPKDSNTQITHGWDQNPDDIKYGLYRLIAYSHGKRHTTILMEEELIDDFGTQKWEDRLKRKVDGLLKKVR